MPVIVLIVFYVMTIIVYKQTKQLFNKEVLKKHGSVVFHMTAMDNRFLM